MAIHPTAIVSPKAELDSGVEVGPYAVIDGPVTIGAGTVVGPHAYLTGHTTIGRDNQIHAGAVLGHEPQDWGFARQTRSYLRVGNRNIFREYCNVHRGTAPESATVIGDDCFLMATAHVGHNCVVGNRVVLCNCALLAGHVRVGDRAFVSGGVVIHQFTQIGRLAMISGNARISMDVPPFTLAAERNEVHALNMVGLRRAGLAPEAVAELKELFRLFYRSGRTGSQALAEADGRFQTPEAREFIAFVKQSANGICPASQRRARRGGGPPRSDA
jgi:UDP-N-acetylglucosamine acyltransferase